MPKGIELGINDSGELEIRCLAHNVTHRRNERFCCTDVMVRAITMGIQQLGDGYHARMLGRLRFESSQQDLPGVLTDIATTPLLAFNTGKGDTPIDN